MPRYRPPPKMFVDDEGNPLPDNVDISKLWYDAKDENKTTRKPRNKKRIFEERYYKVSKDLRLKDIERKKKNLAKLEKEIAYLEYLEKESLNKELAQKLKDKNLDEEHLKRLIAIAEHDDWPPKLKKPSEEEE